MYKELREFAGTAGWDSSFYKDGELVTSVVVGVGVGLWCWFDTEAIAGIRAHLAELLNLSGILFGFVLAAMFFYIQAADAWADSENITRIASRLIDRHVWTVLSLMALIASILIVWCFANKPVVPYGLRCASYAVVGFLVCYCLLQIVNHALTIRWAFRRRKELKGGQAQAATPVSPSHRIQVCTVPKAERRRVRRNR